MRKIFLALALLVSMACQAQKQLEILHTNDTHSCIMPLNVNLADTSVAGRGGFVRRVAMIKQERERNPQLLLIDSGDFSQGSPYYSLFKGEVEIGLMNCMKYDAALKTWRVSSAWRNSLSCAQTTTLRAHRLRDW